MPKTKSPAAWLQDLLFFMLNEKQFDYCYTFHCMDTVAATKPFAFDASGQPVLAAVGLHADTKRLSLRVFHPIVSEFPIEAQVAIMQHEAIHVMDGHLTSYGQRLHSQYGDQIAAIAMELYVNQAIDVSPLQALPDFKPVTLDQFGLPAKLSSEAYCQLLQQMVRDNELQLPQPGQGVPKYIDENGTVYDHQGNVIGRVKPGGSGDGESDENAVRVPGEQSSDGTCNGKPFKGKVYDVIRITKEDASTADQATQSVKQSVTETMKANDQSSCRGFVGGDYAEFVKASKRAATVPWHYHLRVAETSNRNEIVVPTRRRLSRRCKYHLGRVRRHGLDVAVLVDTSGSMGQNQLGLLDPELQGLHSRGAHITVIHCDTDVAKVEKYTPFEPLERFHGRGGTDFSAALLAVQEMQPRPGLFIGFTDGYGGIEEYAAVMIERHGEQWYNEVTAGNPQHSPDGIDSIWLLPEGTMAPESFVNIVPWGLQLVVPAERGVAVGVDDDDYY